MPNDLAHATRPTPRARPQPARLCGVNAVVAVARLDERLSAAPEPVRAGWLTRALIYEAVASQRLNGIYVTAHDLILMLSDTLDRLPDQDLARAVDTHRMLAALMRRNARQLFSPLRLMALTRLRLREEHRHLDDRTPGWLRERLSTTSPERIRDALEQALDPAVIAACGGSSPLEGAGEFLRHWHAAGAAESTGAAAGRALAMAWARRAGLTSGYYLLPSVGFLGHAAAYRPDLKSEWPRAFLDACERAAEWGMKLHGQLLAAHTRMHFAAPGERATSSIGSLIDLLVARPAISARTAAQSLKITPHAARAHLDALRRRGLVHEMTGRDSFRLYALPQ
jgi:hypothetical protein